MVGDTPADAAAVDAGCRALVLPSGPPGPARPATRLPWRPWPSLRVLADQRPESDR